MEMVKSNLNVLPMSTQKMHSASQTCTAISQVQIRCDILVKKFCVCRMHVFMYFLKQYTLCFMENRVSFVEINI